MKRQARQAKWLLIVFCTTLVCFAAHSLLEKQVERNNALHARTWTRTGLLLTDLIHQLQRERGLTNGSIASRGKLFGQALADQYELTDSAIAELRDALRSNPAQFASGDTGTGAPTDVDGLAALRQVVQDQRIFVDTAFSSYTALIAPLLDHLNAATSIAAGNGVLRRQLAFMFLLQTKEYAGQERALLTGMLSAGDYSGERAMVFHRVKGQERAYRESFLQLADADLASTYRNLMEARFVADAEHLRQLVLAAYTGADLPGAMLPKAVQWFELATRKIDALHELEGLFATRLLESEGRPERTLTLSVFGMLLSVALAMALLMQLRRGEDCAGQNIHLAHHGRLLMLGEMASITAHEINQPLAAITNYAGLCARSPSLDANTKKLVGLIERQALRAGKIVWRIHHFARRNATRQPGPVEPQELVESILDDWFDPGADVRFEVTIPQALPAVMVDRVEIEQVLLNLIRNGVQAMDHTAGEKIISIEIQPAALANQVVFRIGDRGCGVPEQFHPGVLKPFFTTRKTGLGLGLSISRSIVAAHGGDLSYSLRSGGGSVFSFTLPAMEES